MMDAENRSYLNARFGPNWRQTGFDADRARIGKNCLIWNQMSYPLRLIARAKLAERQGTYIVIGRKKEGKGRGRSGGLEDV